MEWKVAPSYANYQIISVDENEKKAIVETQCDRCGGSGMYIIPRVFQGTCFACGGAGRIRKKVKAYTPDEYEKYLASQARAKERKAEQKAAELAKLEADSETNFHLALEADGYDVECPQIFVVTGENTYAVKDELKELGCKYKPQFGWYCTHAVDVPVNYGMIGIPFDQVCEWNPIARKILIKGCAKEVADAAKNEVAPKSDSEYIGEVKQRLRDMEVVYTNCREVESQYGISLLYTFKSGENVLVWFCSGKGIDPSIEVGETVLLTGTVKDHKEYNGVKQTRLSRCIVKREE